MAKIKAKYYVTATITNSLGNKEKDTITHETKKKAIADLRTCVDLDILPATLKYRGRVIARRK